MKINSSVPLVSIVITTYNGEKFLAAQLDSIVNQTYTNLEILIYDDASLDGTAQIIRDYAAKDKRIICIFREKNVGLNTNLEQGLRSAKGEYIAISDQDDIWSLEKIALLLKHITNHLAIFSDSKLIDEHGHYFDKTIFDTLKIKNRKHCYKLPALLGKNVVSGHAMLFHRDLLKAVLPFGEALIFDHHLALVASAFDSLIFYPEPLVLHRLHSSNSTNGRLIEKYKKPHEKDRGQLVDKQRRAERIFEKLTFLLSLKKHENLLLAHDGFNSYQDLFTNLEILIHEFKKFDTVFFNFSLFIKLLWLHRKYPEYDLFKPTRCFTLGKGAKWYRQFNRFYKKGSEASSETAQTKPENYYSHSRPRMAAYLPQNAKTCLDIGCGAGRFGELLKKSAPHIEIWGIEIVPSIAAQAKAKLDHVLVGDALSLINQLPDNHFDCIFFNDSLEHMIDPYAMLRAIKPKLKQSGGVIIASIPNIRHFSCLYNLIVKKDWRYAESGVMDFTHLRFFTQNSIRRMFTEANYNVQLLEGVSGSRKLRANIWGWLTFGWMNDIRFKQFAVVAGIK